MVVHMKSFFRILFAFLSDPVVKFIGFKIQGIKTYVSFRDVGDTKLL